MNAAMLCIARRTADESTSHGPTANDPQADDEGAAEVVFALCSCNCDCETAALVRALSLGCPPARPPALSLARKRFSSTGLPRPPSLPTRPLAPSSLFLLLCYVRHSRRGEERGRADGMRESGSLPSPRSPFIRGHRKHEQVGEGREGRRLLPLP